MPVRFLSDSQREQLSGFPAELDAEALDRFFTLSDADLAEVRVRGWLEGNDRWLVVFDNAGDPAAVEAVMPRGGGGRVLVTSRNPNWGALARVLPVDVLAPEEAVAFLLSRSGDIDETMADQLGRELGHLPLAMEQAAAFVAESPGMTLSRYLGLFRARAAALLSRGRSPGYGATVATTWALAFQAVEAALPPADEIPLGLVVSDADRWAEPLDAVADDALALADALGQLRRFSLVTTAVGELVAVHRLVQLVVREQMAEPERRGWAGVVVMGMADAFPADSGDVRTWDRCAVLLPHALAATSHPGVTEGDAAGRTSWLLDSAATYLQGRAQFGEGGHRGGEVGAGIEAEGGSQRSQVLEEGHGLLGSDPPDHVVVTPMRTRPPAASCPHPRGR